jgi:hypothetical protein
VFTTYWYLDYSMIVIDNSIVITCLLSIRDGLGFSTATLARGVVAFAWHRKSSAALPNPLEVPTAEARVAPDAASGGACAGLTN